MILGCNGANSKAAFYRVWCGQMKTRTASRSYCNYCSLSGVEVKIISFTGFDSAQLAVWSHMK